jgi:hypothetical protein
VRSGKRGPYRAESYASAPWDCPHLAPVRDYPNSCAWSRPKPTELDTDTWKLIPRAEGAIGPLKVPLIVRQKVPAKVSLTAS